MLSKSDSCMFPDVKSMAEDVKSMAEGGTQRPIRRSVYGPSSTSAQGISWQYSGSQPNQWIPLSMSAQNILEDALAQGTQQVDLSTTVGLPYFVDLPSMTQTRSSTGYRRQLRRVATTPYTPHTGPLVVAATTANVASTNNAASAGGAVGISAIPPGKSAGGARMVTRQAVRLQVLQNGIGGGNQVQPVNAGPSIFQGFGSANPQPASSNTFGASASSFSLPAGHPFALPSSMLAVPPAVSGMTNVLTGSVLPNVMSSANVSRRIGSIKNDARTLSTDPDSVIAKYSNVVAAPADEDCSICCDSLKEESGYGGAEASIIVQLNKCKHLYHKLCIVAMYKAGSQSGSLQCPTCKTMYGEKLGNCPRGQMDFCVISQPLPSFNCDTIRIVYAISDGMQTAEHPTPGQPYHAIGFPRTCYLPDNDKGRRILKLLIKAWERRLTFTVGTSVTTGRRNSVVWNEIHHKTEFGSNHSGHGFPDPNYFTNVIQELADQGVTENS